MSDEQLVRKLKKYKNELLVGAFLLLTFTSSAWAFQSNKFLERQWKIRQEKEKKLQKLVDLSIQYPDSRDLLYQLALLEWELGNDTKTTDTLMRARYLDPNNPTAMHINATLEISMP